MFKLSTTEWEIALTHLLILALFFAMRSCEYLETRYPEESRRTKILRCKNLTFKKNNRILHHSSTLEILMSADLIIVLFEFQKNDWRNHSVHMFRTDDPLLCPVIAGAITVKRVLSIPGATPDSKLCCFLLSEGKVTYINSAQALPRLRAVVEIIGKVALGFTKDDVGLHSIRSGGAMAMFLAGTRTIIIMRIGRWSSEAFLEYIREQVEDFTRGVSKNMLRFEHFNTTDSEDPELHSEELGEIFIANNKSDGAPSIPIEHEIKFTESSFGNLKL